MPTPPASPSGTAPLSGGYPLSDSAATSTNTGSLNDRNITVAQESPGQSTALYSGESKSTSDSVQLTKRQLKLIQPPKASDKSDASINLNGHVAVNGPYVSGNTVECRHLAGLFATYGDPEGVPGKKRELMSSFSSPADIAATFDGQLASLDDRHMSRAALIPPAAKHLVSSDQLGQYLSSLGLALNHVADQGPSEVNCLLSTNDHTMAIHLQRKSDEGGEVYFAAILYDPNVTANYKRVERSTPEGFSDLKISDMMINTSSIVGLDNTDEPVPLIGMSLEPRVIPAFDRSETVVSPANMNLALASGALIDLDAMLQTKPSIEVLGAKDSQGTPGLYFALYRGHTDTVASFTRAVALSDFSSSEKAQLLANEGNDRNLGSYNAFFYEHAGAIEAFVSSVKSASLSEDQEFELLSAKNPGGLPGLSLALQVGGPEMVATYVQAVMNVGLSIDQQTKLLAAKDNDNVPGLFAAFELGNSAAIEAFTQAVAHSDLTSIDKVQLLAAENQNQLPGALIALQNGHAEAFEVFASAVKSAGTSDAQHMKLLLAKESGEDGMPGLMIALNDQQTEAVSTYARAVLNSGLSSDQQVELLSVELPGGDLFLPMLKDSESHNSVIEAFSKEITQSTLSTSQKNKVLGRPTHAREPLTRSNTI